MSDERAILRPFYDGEHDDDDVNVLVGATEEKGWLLVGKLHLDEDFDPSKLTIRYHQTGNGRWIGMGFEYDDDDAVMSNDLGVDVQIYDSEFYWLLDD